VALAASPNLLAKRLIWSKPSLQDFGDFIEWLESALID
jgi:hypothetical protein